MSNSYSHRKRTDRQLGEIVDSHGPRDNGFQQQKSDMTANDQKLHCNVVNKKLGRRRLGGVNGKCSRRAETYPPTPEPGASTQHRGQQRDLEDRQQPENGELTAPSEPTPTQTNAEPSERDTTGLKPSPTSPQTQSQESQIEGTAQSQPEREGGDTTRLECNTIGPVGLEPSRGSPLLDWKRSETEGTTAQSEPKPEEDKTKLECGEAGQLRVKHVGLRRSPRAHGRVPKQEVTSTVSDRCRRSGRQLEQQFQQRCVRGRPSRKSSETHRCVGCATGSTKPAAPTSTPNRRRLSKKHSVTPADNDNNNNNNKALPIPINPDLGKRNCRQKKERKGSKEGSPQNISSPCGSRRSPEGRLHLTPDSDPLRRNDSIPEPKKAPEETCMPEVYTRSMVDPAHGPNQAPRRRKRPLNIRVKEDVEMVEDTRNDNARIRTYFETEDIRKERTQQWVEAHALSPAEYAHWNVYPAEYAHWNEEMTALDYRVISAPCENAFSLSEILPSLQPAHAHSPATDNSATSGESLPDYDVIDRALHSIQSLIVQRYSRI